MEAGELSKTSSTHSLNDETTGAASRPPVAKILLNGKSLSQEEKPGLLKKIKALRGAQTSSTKTAGDSNSEKKQPVVNQIGLNMSGISMLAPPVPPPMLQRNTSTEPIDKSLSSNNKKDNKENGKEKDKASKRKKSEKLANVGEVPKKSTVLGLPLLCCTYFAAIYSLVSFFF
jgi:hypothetical protein